MSEPTCDRCDKPMAEERGRRVGMRDASEVVCLDTEAEICKSVAEAFRQGRTSVEVGDRLFLWGGAVPGNTEEQVAKIIAEKIKRREAEQTQMMNLMSERAQSNPLIFRLSRAIREAWKETPKDKPRSKRGQRVRRWR